MHISSAGAFTLSVAHSSTPANDRAAEKKRDWTVIEMEANAQAIDAQLSAKVNNPEAPLSHIPREYLVLGLQNLVEELDAIITEHGTTERIIDIEGLMRGATSSLDHTILQIDDLTLFENSGHSPETDIYIQRAQYIVDAIGEMLGKLGRNEFEGDLGRWASNLTISGLRTGLFACILTTVRQLIGFTLEKSLQTNAASPLTRNVIGGLSLMVGPALNIIGALKDEYEGTANSNTRLARFATLLLSMGALLAAAAAPQALPALASYGPQVLFYTFANDLANLLLPHGDNATPSATGAVATGGLNGALQFLAFTAMSTTAPKSGPGYAMSAGSAPSTESDVLAAQLADWMQRTADVAASLDPSPENRATEILESLTPVIGHDVLRGAYNAAADVTSQVIGGEIMHALQADKDPGGFRIKLGQPTIPTARQVANQLLTTNAVRTSMSQTIVAVVISASRYFSTLPISRADVDHIANALVAAVVFAGRPGVMYASQGSKPAEPSKSI